MDLYKYQKDIADRLINIHPGMNGAPHVYLAVDPGLGKTPIVCDTIRRMKLKTALIVCPVKIKTTWAARLVEWGACGQDDIFICWSRADKIPASAKVVIVNYQLLNSRYTLPGQKDVKRKKKAPNPLFKQIYARSWEVMVFDEAQALKNLTSAITFTVFNRNGHPLVNRGLNIWLLSGSPMDKNEHLYPPSKSLAPHLIAPYDNRDDYYVEFCGGYRDPYGVVVAGSSTNTKELAKRLAPFMVQVRIEDVADQMPEHIEDVIYMDSDKVKASIDYDYAATVYKAVGEAKIKWISEYIKDTYGELKEKLLICAHHRSVIESYAEQLKDFFPVIIYGGLSEKETQARLDLFTKGDSMVCLINETVAGVGLDGLQLVCNRLLYAENDWTDQMRRQVLGRLLRKGQTKTVYSTTFVARKTFDVNVKNTQNSKERTVETFYKQRTLEKMANQNDKFGVDSFLASVLKGVEELVQVVKEILEKVSNIESALANSAAPGAKDTKAAKDKDKAAPKSEAKTEAKSEAKASEGGLTEQQVRDEAGRLIGRIKVAGYDQKEAETMVKELNVKVSGDPAANTIKAVDSRKYGELVSQYNAFIVPEKEGEV